MFYRIRVEAGYEGKCTCYYHGDYAYSPQLEGRFDDVVSVRKVFHTNKHGRLGIEYDERISRDFNVKRDELIPIYNDIEKQQMIEALKQKFTDNEVKEILGDKYE